MLNGSSRSWTTFSTVVPLSALFPIRCRQILRASLSRFFDSRLHSGLVAFDLSLIALRQWDVYGFLSYPWVHLVLVSFLAYEAAIFSVDLVYQTLYYRSYFYNLQKESVVIGRGVLCKKEITLPLGKITDVYVEQDFVSRMLGLYDVHLSTPTGRSGKSAHMSGVDKRSAHALRNAIVHLVNQANPSLTLQPKAE